MDECKFYKCSDTEENLATLPTQCTTHLNVKAS